MIFPYISPRLGRAVSLAIGLSLLAICAQPGLRAADNEQAVLPGHLPPLMARSRKTDRVASQESISLALALPVRDQAGLSEFLYHVSTPGDPLYGKWLTPEQFTERFGPTEADYEAVANYARANGLNVTAAHANRLVLDVTGPAGSVEKAFGTRLFHFQAPDGTVFRAPESEPVVPGAIAARLDSIVGLNNAGRWHPHFKERTATSGSSPQALSAAPHGGTGPAGGLSPQNIRTAYNLTGVTQTGAGQAIAVFELTGYKSSDITAYEKQFGLPAVTLQNVLVDGANGAAGSGADEVTLDIELAIALAPGASKVLVYEGPNSDNGVIDTYNRIATDNLAKQASTSWGLDEADTSASVRNAENTIFQQMAAQGQSIYSAAGDEGAYDDGATLSVDDPSSQPYMTAVGGTTLKSGTAATYISEKTWNAGSITAGAGGGGISRYWPIPAYQTAAISTTSKGSTTRRNIPDVSLNSDPNSGYSIYYNGGWHVYGGTSCAAPLWAGFTALVNEKRSANGLSAMGFANPLLYTLGEGTRYGSDFHDIADNSTNLFYPAVTGYDDATGWGSFNGANLFSDLAGTAKAVPFDFNSDGTPDIVWQNWTTGDATYWVMNNGQWTGSWAYLTIGTATNWKIVAAPDLDGNGQPDLVWQDQITGDVSYWIMNKGVWTGSAGYIARNIPAGWKVTTAGDLFGDGSVSLVLQNISTGAVAYWKLNGASWNGNWGTIGQNSSTDWRIVGSADLDGDKQSDLIWQNLKTGDVAYWKISGGAYSGTSGIIASAIPLDWRIEGVLDVTGDGQPDLIWRNQASGDVTYWKMSGAQWTGAWDYLGHNIPVDWKIAGVH